MMAGKGQKCINMPVSMVKLSKGQVESSLHVEVSSLEAPWPHRDLEVYISAVSSLVLWDLLCVFPYLLTSRTFYVEQTDDCQRGDGWRMGKIGEGH